jgi:hypothetical protein
MEMGSLIQNVVHPHTIQSTRIHVLHLKYILRYCQKSSVCIMMVCDERIGVRFQAGTRDIYLLYTVEARSCPLTACGNTLLLLPTSSIYGA